MGRVFAAMLAVVAFFAAPRAHCDESRDKLEELAKWCKTRGLKDEAAITRKWWLEPATDRLLVFVPADPNGVAVSVPAAGQDDRGQWIERFTKWRHERADVLAATALERAKASDGGAAIGLWWQALREKPRHEAARRALGFVVEDGRWLTPYAARQIRSGRVWHAKYGWIAKEDVPRYDKGERRGNGRWVSAEDDARQHASIRRGWQVETDHYLLTTNHSLEEGVRLASTLEVVYRAWQQAFAGYWLTPADVKARIRSAESTGRATTPAASTAKKHRVVCFATREEYTATLGGVHPRAETSLGLYLDTARTVYFFAGKDQDPGTLVHEATHQLFKETRATVKQPGLNDNFWIVEGVACYMESLRKHASSDASSQAAKIAVLALGGIDGGRVPDAKARLDKGFFVPLARLAPLSYNGFQAERELPNVYEQTAGMVNFLMHAKSAAYREPLLKYLEAVYAGKATPTTLADRTGVTFEQLDAEYRAYMRDVASTNPKRK